MDFNAIIENWKTIVTQKYICFNGRATRTEYWSFVLPNIVISFIPVVGWIFALAMLLPTLGAAARRLHDIGKTEWLLILALFPCVNLILLYFLLQPSQAEDNPYGPAPSKNN